MAVQSQVLICLVLISLTLIFVIIIFFYQSTNESTFQQNTNQQLITINTKLDNITTLLNTLISGGGGANILPITYDIINDILSVNSNNAVFLGNINGSGDSKFKTHTAV